MPPAECPVPRVRLDTLGCRLNEAETESWARAFQEHGCRLVGDGDPADLIVLNTCAVTAEAARRSRQWLRRARRAQPGARLIVSGCLATLEGPTLAEADLIVANPNKDQLVARSLGGLKPPPALPERTAAAALFARGRQRAFVKIQDGCRHRCAFCVTTLARGPERSRPVADLVAEVQGLVASGVREAVLTGVHLGGYGQDLGTDLTALIRRLLAETDLPRLRLGALEPWGLPDTFWALFAGGRLLPHLHLPLQSGSDRVLRRMGRRCRAAGFAALAARARAAVPDLNLTTDLIVGFPGERADDWRRTLDFAAMIGFGDIHGFAYSPRPGTLAASFPDPVDGSTRRQRLRELRALTARLRRATLTAWIGRRTRVLGEGVPVGLARPLSGYTENYLPLDGEPGVLVVGNPVIEVQVTGLDANGERLRGRPAAG